MSTYVATGYDPAAKGCTYPGCGTQQTTHMDGIHGRRCASHPSGFDPGHAVRLMVAGHADAALDYVRRDTYRLPCPECRTEVLVLDGGRLAFHYMTPGIGPACPGSGVAA